MSIDLETTYQRYGPMVLRRCRRLLPDEEHALDAMHDVFVQVLRRGADLEVAEPARWLMRAATNVCLNRLRTLRRHPETPADAVLLRIAEAPDATEDLAAARSFLARVFRNERASTREIAVMHLVEGMTLEEVAREVNLSVSGVRKRLRTLRARAAELEGAEP